MDGNDGTQSRGRIAAERHLLVRIEVPHLEKVHRFAPPVPENAHHTRGHLHGA
jgi:hypothetical protein